MSTGVKLRCINSPNSAVPAGRVYEVAEILELPGHAMVRKPNGKWPRPGEAQFGMHPEVYFEKPTAGIPAFSCGFDNVEEEFFGVIIPASLLRMRLPLTDRAVGRTSAIVDAEGIAGLWWLAFHNVVTESCWPEELERSFLLLGIDYSSLDGRTGRQRAAKAMQRIMRKLGIRPSSMLPVQEQLIAFWNRSWRKPGPWTWRTPKKWPAC